MKQFFISFLLFCITQKVICQVWVPLGSNEETSNSIASTAANTFFTQLSSDGIPYISYIDDVGGGNNLGDFKTHAKRFINGQWEFAGGGISPQFPGSDNFPVALDGNLPYVAYSEALNPVDLQSKLSVRKLNSATGNWDIVGQLGISDGPATGTAIAAANGHIYVAYTDGSINSKITVKHFDNANPGNGWRTLGPAGFSGGFILGTNITIDNGIPYVSYLDFGDNHAYVKKFNGTAWEDVGTNNPAGGLQVVIRSLKFNSNHIPFICFVDLVTGAGSVRNLSAANDWVTTGGQSFGQVDGDIMSLTLLHDIPFIAFGKVTTNPNLTIQVNVKRFNAANNSWPDVGAQPVTNSFSTIDNVALTAGPNNKLFLMFRNFNLGLYAKTFDAGTIVPVTLTSFTVSRQDNKALLQWHTVTEADNRLFEIEHSVDGVTFTKIGEATAQLPPDIPHDYNFIHTTPANGINFYRLKQVDINGSFTYSNIVNITFGVDPVSAIKIFPNPVKDILHVTVPVTGIKEIIIRDAGGKAVKKLKSSDRTIDINVAGLPAGTYFMNLHTETIDETRVFVK